MFPTLLPLEIFKVITAYLSDNDIITCQTVCSVWYKKWIAYKYYHIHIKGTIRFKSFFSTLQQPLYASGTTWSIGYQIRKLIIENGHIDPSTLGQLPTLCPYLEVFMFDGVTLSESAKRELFQCYQQRKNEQALDKVKHQFSIWSRMRHITELNGISLSLTLLNQNTSLVSISVQFNNLNDRTNQKSLFINSLIHAPLLQTFSADRIYLDMEELEIIHTSCPHLKSLYLIDAILLPSKSVSTNKYTIVPANSLESFHFINGSFCDDVAIWLDYISQKYIYARTIDIGTCSFFSEDDDSDVAEGIYEPQLILITKRCLKLKSLNLQSFSLGPRFFKSLDQNSIALQELTLGDGRTMNLAKEIKGLLNSEQQHYIQTLTIHGWPLTSNMRGLHLLMTSLIKCTHITTLNLSLGRLFYQPAVLLSSPVIDTTTLYFDLILRACPQLNSLSVTDARIIASEYLSEVSIDAALESLRFENVIIDSRSHIFQLLSSHCTKLKSLSLISTIPSPMYHNTRNFNIYLPNHHLQTLVLDRIRVSGKCNARLGTSKFKLTTKSHGSVWYDLVAYESFNNRQFVYNNQQSSGQIHTSDSVIIQNETMRARKFKKIEDAQVSYMELDQTVYVSVFCKEVEALCLSGLIVT